MWKFCNVIHHPKNEVPLEPLIMHFLGLGYMFLDIKRAAHYKRKKKFILPFFSNKIFFLVYYKVLIQVQASKSFPPFKRRDQS